VQNKPNKNLLICEFITGGGFCAAPLPDSLAKEGMMMRDALLRDLTDLSQYTLIGMHDARLSPSPLTHESHAVEGDAAAFKQVFEQLIKKADYVWLIAPETDGILISLCELCYAEEEARGAAILIGNGYDTVLIGTSKSLTFSTLHAERIHTLPVFAGDELLEEAYFKSVYQSKSYVKQWLAKPEDGAGCEGIRLFNDLSELRDWLVQADLSLNYFAQPYQAGTAASFCMLCAEGKAWLLSANQQHVVQKGNQFQLNGVTLNGLPQYWQRFETIARKLAKAMPDALGYVGVDVIIDPEQAQIKVIDINPRLTTSYVGLREAIGINPAQLILDCVLRSGFKMPAIRKQTVEVMI
jgi:predicted ATP-grasp superfamily ATP-dependent carboligase